jgi:glutamate-1-semialdehyde 2,1-aminomutase
MPQSLGTNSPIVARYREKTPRSAALFERALDCFPSGLTHDSRRLDPYPLYVERAEGARKWDVDGNEYVDYFGGHGALILGHCAPAVVEAVQRQVARGTHLGAAHELEVRWAELVKRLVPCAERVRFTSSGTEASHLVLRLAKAFTGRRKILRFLGHFHGWHDQVAAGSMSNYDGSAPIGVSADAVENTILMPTDDVAPTLDALASRDDIAAVILEPTGASWGQVPLPPGFLEALRTATAKSGALLVFDEVIAGFRLSPGGAQQATGVTPDLCILAKILAGGLPGGAVAGRKDIMDLLDFEAAQKSGRGRVGHQGTFNANPLSAAAAVATLEIVAGTDACARAAAAGARLRDGMNEVLAEEGVPWAAYGEGSIFHVFTNPEGAPVDPRRFDPHLFGFKVLKAGRNMARVNKLRLAMLVAGVDIMGAPGGMASAVHGAAELDRTIGAFREAVRALRAEDELSGRGGG